jgi:hypothetical protein
MHQFLPEPLLWKKFFKGQAWSEDYLLKVCKDLDHALIFG